jgi:hypothetical protein
MKTRGRHHRRIVTIAPSTRGFGFAVIEGDKTLVDWGVKSVKGDKNRRSLVKAEALLLHYRPALLVLEDHSGRRSKRIRTVSSMLADMAKRHGINVRRIRRSRVYRAFGFDEKGTKHALAEVLGNQFQKELEHRLPPKRRPWMSEDYRTGIFDAVALGVAPSLLNQQRRAKATGH